MQIELRYQQALDYLSGFIDYSLKNQETLATADINLDRVFDLAASIGNPQDKYPSVHVAGSKGKGSVCVLCASALQAQGYKVGLYTSPHLHYFEERIQINREMISQTDLVQIVDEIKPHVAAVPSLTVYEIETVLAFWYFARQEVDVAVVEVGLGGRLDATNIIVPQVSVITALFREHTVVLGDTLEEIAAEKAGIIKPGVPVVLSPQRENAHDVISQIAVQKEAPVVRVEDDYVVDGVRVSLENQTFMIRTKKNNNQGEFQINLLGPHQIENALTAYATLHTLRDKGILIDESGIRKGFSMAKWPARFEILHQNPPVVIDAAHTPEAARKLRQTVDMLFPNRPLVLVFGVSQDKDIVGMFSELLSTSQLLICTKSSHPRAMDVDALMEIAVPYGIPLKATEDVEQAVIDAIRVAGEEAVVLITGSIFLAGNARQVLKESE